MKRLTPALLLLLLAGRAFAVYTPAPTPRPTVRPPPTPTSPPYIPPTPPPYVYPTSTPTSLPTATPTPPGASPVPTATPPMPTPGPGVGASLSPPWAVSITVRNYPPGATIHLTVVSPSGDKMHQFDLAVAGPDPWSTGFSLAGMPSGSRATLQLRNATGTVVSTNTAVLP